MSAVQDPRKTWLATGSLLTVWWRMPSLGPRLPFAFWLWLSPTCLSTPGGREGLVCSRLSLLWCLLNPLLCEQAMLRLRLELFTRKFSLSLSGYPSLGCCLTLAPSDCPQGIQAQSLAEGAMMQCTPPCPAPSCWWWTRASGLFHH